MKPNNADLIEDYLRKYYGPFTVEGLARRLKISQSTVRKHLSRLRDEGKAERELAPHGSPQEWYWNE